MRCGWSQLACGISAGNAEAVGEFYRLFREPVKHYLGRLIEPGEVDGRVHELLEQVVRQVQRGDLREPERLFAYTWAIVRHEVADWRTPQIIAAAARLRAMPAYDREALGRFYLRGQSPESICADLALTAAEFREIKVRARSLA